MFLLLPGLKENCYLTPLHFKSLLTTLSGFSDSQMNRGLKYMGVIGTGFSLGISSYSFIV